MGQFRNNSGKRLRTSWAYHFWCNFSNQYSWQVRLPTRLSCNWKRTTRDYMYLVTLVYLIFVPSILTWHDDLGTRTWPRYSEGIPA